MGQHSLSKKLRLDSGGPRTKARLQPINKTPQELLQELKANRSLEAGNLAIVKLSTDNWMDVDDEDYNTLPLPPPPGEEGLFHSHAGDSYVEGEDGLLSSLFQARGGDSRIRTDLVWKQVDSWYKQLPVLVNAYLEFQNQGPPTNAQEVATWQMPTMDFHSHHNQTLFHTSQSTSINETLAQNGLLGGSPESPNIAFSFGLLDAFRQIRRVCPRYSVEGLAKSLQYIHKLPGDPHLERQLQTTYDAYLMIMREVCNRTAKALFREG
ncbi:hypothetical protein E1B28_001906 [Marasmius oreades]|uniref:Uncharacterized protein n=1 Tax=Marasmius oreades TaxID=181124 RepID=A0A9P7V4J1_9AGAR|nr:uncharacterized protein E1B28_001906 [Marasmius oreades]KAG7100126.1 hypothetical protein E1B28_001906 [Marasmius oreades]